MNDKAIESKLKKHGFDYPLNTKKEIFDRILENLQDSDILCLDDLFILSDITESEVLQIFNKKFVDLITNTIQKNVVKLKTNTIGDLRLNADAASKKLLLQLTSNRSQYERISNQWSININALDDFEILLPDMED